MKFLLVLAAWTTLTFIPSWLLHHSYQPLLASVAAKLAVPGSEIEFIDLEIFYPFDLGVYVALCLASGWVGWPRRLRSIAIGLPILIGIEIVSLAIAIRVLFHFMSDPAAAAGPAGDQAYRLATGIIRVTGLIAAASVWLYQLGRERLSVAARTWLGS